MRILIPPDLGHTNNYMSGTGMFSGLASTAITPEVIPQATGGTVVQF